MNLRRYVRSAFVFALMPLLAAQSEDTKAFAGNLENEEARDSLYVQRILYTTKALQIVDDFDEETPEELFEIKFKRIRKAPISYLIALEKTRLPFTKVEMSCDAKNPIKKFVVAVDADHLALKEDEILKMFGNESERGAASASHGGTSCNYLIYRTKTCSSTFSFRGEGNKYLTALMVNRY